jgi:tetratricopeptide (TPR) repeat protein
MPRRLVHVGLAVLFLAGCAGPSKLAQKSEENLAAGDYLRAWQLATRALDRDPGNPRARAAAAEAGNALTRDWEQRIHVLAQTDSLAAANEVLELAEFRLNAVHYAAIPVDPIAAREEQTLRHTAARVAYQHGLADLARRPKSACLHFEEAQHYVPDYRDAARLADETHARALSQVAVAPFFVASGPPSLGRDVAADWRDHLAAQLVAPDARFTSVLGSAAIEQQMSLSQLGRLSRDDAMKLGRRAGADRVVWGSINGIDSQTRFHLFTDMIVRRVVEKNAAGEDVTHWVDVPVEVVSRVRTVTVDVDYEVIATRTGATLAHQRTQRATSARVVWTSFTPDGDLGAYALVSDVVRAANPERAKAVEGRWSDVCGSGTTLRQVLEARRATRSDGHYDHDALPRFIAGATFVFLQDLPPTEDLAFAALSGGWQPVRADLLRLDATDDVDLGLTAGGSSTER